MRLFVESSAIFAERSGIGQFSKRLIEAYHKKYPETQIRLFGFKFLTRKFIPPIQPSQQLRYRLIRWLPGRIYTGLFKNGAPFPIDILIGASPNDVVLFPNFVRWPLAFNRRSVSFIHDLSFIFYGQYSSGPNREYMLRYVPQTIAKSNHIITISESSKRDIIKQFGIPESKISIVNPFIDTTIFKPVSGKELATAQNKFNLPKKYILFVSSIEPRKNVVGLLEAYEKLPRKLQDEYALVLAGGKGWLNEPIHEKADKLIASGLTIIRTGYVPDEDLPAIYSGASLFAFPSFYEGFGIPPLEAMACGVPVVTSNNSSLPEVVGDAAILVEATDAKAISQAMKQVLDSKKIQKELVTKGLIQAKKFSPERSAEQLYNAIQKIL